VEGGGDGTETDYRQTRYRLDGADRRRFEFLELTEIYRMKVRRVAVGAISAGVVLSMTIFAGSQVLAAHRAKTVTITVETWSSTPLEEKFDSQLVKTFMKKNPGIKVNYPAPFNGDFETHIKTEFVAGTAPDVFYMDVGWAQDFMRDGVVQAVNGYAAHTPGFDPSDFYPNLVKGFTYKGKVYGYPKDQNTIGLFWNKTMFHKAGISGPPTTTQQFTADCIKIHKKLHVYGASLSPDPARWFAFVKAYGGRIFNPKQTKVELNTSAASRAGRIVVLGSSIRGGTW
jgi:multiple sugar transport system substrate-binding protein